MINRKTVPGLLSIGILSAAMIGCATSSSVDRKIAEAQAQTDTKIESVAGQVEDLQEKQKQTDVRLEELGRSASEALQRAQEAGVLAKGKVIFQQTLAEDRVKFPVNSYTLDDDSRKALDELATRIKTEDKGVWIEIQGHTDNRGGSEYNEILGERRAEAVRRYLSKEHQLPLARMSTISYGETLPVSDNKTRAGREQNRRVVVVVLE
jgi:peptidoglycan-associated lipoprotein